MSVSSASKRMTVILVSLIALLALLVAVAPSRAYAEVSQNEHAYAAQSLKAQSANTSVPAPTIQKLKPTTNDDGTFDLRVEWKTEAGMDDYATLDIELVAKDTNAEVSHAVGDVSKQYSYATLTKIPAEYGGKTLVVKLTLLANPYSILYQDDSRTAVKTVDMPASVKKATEADLNKLAKTKVKTSSSNYGGYLKKGTSFTWKHGLYTLTVKATNVTSKEYTLQAEITTKAIAQEPYENTSYPTNHYFLFGDSKINSTKYSAAHLGSADYLYDFGQNNLTCTMKMTIPASSLKAGWNAIGFNVVSHNVASVGNKMYWFEFLKKPGKPYIGSAHSDANSKATTKSLAFEISGKAGTVQYQYRKNGAKSWKSAKTTKSVVALKKLSASTTYQIRMRNIVKSKNRAGTSKTVRSAWSPVVKLATTPSAKPVISSIDISGATSSTYWQPGHWTSYTSSGVWVPGKYVTSTSYNVRINLARAVKGANGCIVKYGNNLATGKLSNGGKTITIVGGGASIGSSQSFSVAMLANPTYENQLVGQGKWSAARSAVVRK